MKVKIMQRSVYHKYAELEIEIPNEIKDEDVQDYLIDNDDLFIEKIDEELEKVEYEYGTGVHDYEGMEEFGVSCEQRFNIVGKNYGGHL